MSRARLDEAVRISNEYWRGWTEATVLAATERKAADQAFRDLTERMLQMRREGFQPPTEPVPAESPTPALPTAVADAIDAVSTSGPMARQLHQTALRLLRQEGGDADKVATLIRQGDDPDVLEDFLG